MKFATFFVSAAALAVSAVAEPVRIPQAHRVRDIAAIESAATSVTTAIKTLTKSVAAFSGDSIQVEADAGALVASIEIGIEGIAKSGDLDITGLVGLQSCITTLTDAGKDLIQKLTIKKSQFEQAGLCGTVEKFMSEIGDQSQNLIKTVSGLLPEQFQGVVEQVGGAVAETLLKGATAFSESNCVDNPAANTSKSLVPYPTGTLTFSAIAPVPTTKTSTIQVTVTSCTNAVTQTSISIVKPTTSFTPSVVPPYTEVPPAASSTVLITAPEPTVSTSLTVVVPPAASTTKPALPVTSIPIAAGPRNAVGGAGLVAVAAVVAAMLI
ncbi:uncharacterized protein B0I36DRAFT_321789 [Microdochium trichocladiopsis]|uniref:Cell wall protein n=1 Tax=Microdochium trichocladiopsis TaxID=1682393 RepID=A0A9P8YCL3_9PEZI|nr:uncharacterized protein B0I36DRAFT_321789 [Microdochium trichocladiopsis]KAH7033623.1 hypothetical protein B0I36DRAFT_321789 [Microdochium trichocladiopsis]